MELRQLRQTLKEGFEKQRRRIEQDFAGLGPKELAWRPDEKTWSVGQCLYHMWITNDKYLAKLDRVIRESNFKEKDKKKYKSSWMGARFIGMVGPDGGKSTPVPKALIPEYKKVPKDVVVLLIDQIEGILEFVSESDGVDLRKTKMSSPIAKVIRLPLGDVFLALLGHNDRHLNQATRLMRTGAFQTNARGS